MRESNEQVHKRANMEPIIKEPKVVEINGLGTCCEWTTVSAHEWTRFAMSWTPKEVAREDALEKHGVGKWRKSERRRVLLLGRGRAGDG